MDSGLVEVASRRCCGRSSRDSNIAYIVKSGDNGIGALLVESYDKYRSTTYRQESGRRADTRNEFR